MILDPVNTENGVHSCQSVKKSQRNIYVDRGTWITQSPMNEQIIKAEPDKIITHQEKETTDAQKGFVK